MCKVGDIIVVNKYQSAGMVVNKHSFVVLEDKEGIVKGLAFDFVALAMSSFKDEVQKERKMKYPGNFPIVAEDVDVPYGNRKSGYIKAEQFFYFNKSKIEYTVVGRIEPEIFNLLLDFINELVKTGIHFDRITDNL